MLPRELNTFNGLYDIAVVRFAQRDHQRIIATHHPVDYPCCRIDTGFISKVCQDVIPNIGIGTATQRRNGRLTKRTYTRVNQCLIVDNTFGFSRYNPVSYIFLEVSDRDVASIIVVVFER